MNALTEGIITIALAGFTLAVISVLVSKKANTAADIQAAASGEGNIILAATSPVTGNAPTGSLAYPSNALGSTFGF
jgi:hypothetical protein